MDIPGKRWQLSCLKPKYRNENAGHQTEASKKMLEAINTAALWIGYVVIAILTWVVAFKIAWPFMSYRLWSKSSQDAKEMAAQMGKEGYDTGLSATIFDMLLEGMDDLMIDGHIKYEPSPLATLDWSIDDPQSIDVNVMKSALEDAGYYVHPFPLERDGEWSNQHVGVWKGRPRWYVEGESVETGDPEKVRVTPKLPSREPTSN